MSRNDKGFTLTELLITMLVFIVVIMAAANILIGILNQFKQQAKSAEMNIEGIVGLEMMKRDIEHAGYGLAWNLNTATYSEALNDAATPHDDQTFNDGPPNNPTRGTELAGASNPPGALRSGNGLGTYGSDIIVVKAVSVATNGASSKWTHLFPGNTVTEWNPTSERMVTNDRAVVHSLTGNTARLIMSGGTFTARYNAAAAPDGLTVAGFAPTDNSDVRVVYGIADADNSALRMPFNRADFYMRVPATAGILPSRCAIGTGILYKATVNQADGNMTELPLLDCVADMQVIYGRDTDADGSIDNVTDDISALTSVQVRQQVKQVRIYVLAQEGQRDIAFTFDTNPIYVGDASVGSGRNFNFATAGITDWQNYRWKLLTLIVSPKNLR